MSFLFSTNAVIPSSGLSLRINKNSLWDELNVYNEKGNGLSRKSPTGMDLRRDQSSFTIKTLKYEQPAQRKKKVKRALFSS